MAQAVGNPLAVFHVGLATGNSFDVTSVDEYYFKMPVEEVENRFPVDPSAFYGDVSALVFNEPVQHAQKVRSHGRKGTNLALAVFNETGKQVL